MRPKQEPGCFKLKPGNQISQTSFIKQYQTFLQKNRKTTPLRDYASKRLSPKPQASPVTRSPFKPLFTQQGFLRKTPPKLSIQSVSPTRNNGHSSYKSESHSMPKEPEKALFDFDIPKSLNSTALEKSQSVVSIFQESTKQLEAMQQQGGRPELQKGIQDILSLIKKEKQIILNDMKQMTKQMQKYKTLYEEQQDENQQLLKQNEQLQDSKEISKTNNINETYAQMIYLLKSMSVEHSDVLPEIGDQPQSVEPMDKDDVIIIQKLIIKKLVKKIEDTRQLNQLLLTKLKEQ